LRLSARPLKVLQVCPDIPRLPGREGHGIASLEPYITAIKKNFDTLLAVEAHPPEKRCMDRQDMP
jgi:hypothetical protein